MKSVKYVLERCENAVNAYISETADDLVRQNALCEIDLLTDILELEDIPFRLLLRLHHVLYDALYRKYEHEAVLFE